MECTTPTLNPDVNYGLCIVMHHCRFINCKKCTTLVGNVVLVWVQAVGGRSLDLPLNFAVNLKLLWKIKCIKGKKKCNDEKPQPDSWLPFPSLTGRCLAHAGASPHQTLIREKYSCSTSNLDWYVGHHQHTRMTLVSYRHQYFPGLWFRSHHSQ